MLELSMHSFHLEFFCLLVFRAGLKLILDILGSSFVCHVFCLDWLRLQRVFGFPGGVFLH